MPIYQFSCNSCNTQFEERRSFSQSDAPGTCPTCQSQDSQKIFNAVTVFAYDSTAADRKNFPAKLARENQHTCSAGHFGGHSH
ncbi:MAG: zinc ribbon domain-containing protein [Chloroflexota bacterium]|nr:MAG: zinc ribbon domain-containing protein [Chloroflexota bacterium]